MEQVTEPERKIKIQKRTPTERQLESLEKARLSKQKKKIIREHSNSSSFLSPPPYMTGLILLGCAGLVGYSYMKEQKNYPSMVQGLPKRTPQSVTAEPAEPAKEPKEPKEPNILKTLDFFSGSTRV